MNTEHEASSTNGVPKAKRKIRFPRDPDWLVGIVELSARLELPLKWCRREAQAGRFPCVRIAGRLHFHPPAVAEHLRKRAERKNQHGRYPD